MIVSNPRIPFQLGDERPSLPAFNGKRLLVHLCMNIEYWPIERPMPRGVLPAPHGVATAPPDVPNFSWVEYGLRCGMPRIMGMLAERNIKASAFMNAQVSDVYPRLTDRVLQAEWELVGHGWFQQSLKQVDDEEEVIIRCLKRLEALSGQKTRAWLGAGLGETDKTPDLLRQHGVEFLHDWVLDDLPFWMWTEHGPMVGLPYTFELNDVPIYAIQHGASDEILTRTKATLDMFERELERQVRIITFGLHPHIIGVPHVAHQFEKAIDLLIQRDDTVFVTSSQMGDWFTNADPDGAAQVQAWKEAQR